MDDLHQGYTEMFLAYQRMFDDVTKMYKRGPPMDEMEKKSVQAHMDEMFNAMVVIISKTNAVLRYDAVVMPRVMEEYME